MLSMFWVGKFGLGMFGWDLRADLRHFKVGEPRLMAHA